MRNIGLVKTLLATAAIAACRIVVLASETQATQAASATDKSVGVSDLGADAAGDPVDVILEGIATVEYGGNVAAGDLLTADAQGRAIVAAPAAGANARVIGTAMAAGVLGDRGSVLLAVGSIQG